MKKEMLDFFFFVEMFDFFLGESFDIFFWTCLIFFPDFENFDFLFRKIFLDETSRKFYFEYSFTSIT